MNNLFCKNTIHVSLLIFGTLFYGANLHAQHTTVYNESFSFTVDNDVFLLKFQDSYYTNGFFLQYSKAQQKNNVKKITRIELGQSMYNTRERRRVWSGDEILDRQYCGYLFARIATDHFLKNDAFLNLKAEVGVTGDLSLARQLQEWYHKVLGLFDYPYWETQIPNSIGINLGAKYVAPINAQQSEYNLFRIITASEVNFGSYFNNAKSGAYFCFGKFNKVENTALFNNHINTTSRSKNTSEWMLFFNPMVTYQAYNGTIQGNVFKPMDKSYLWNIQPFIYQHSFGAMYAKNKWATKIEAVYLTREGKSQIQNHRYISLQTAYRF